MLKVVVACAISSLAVLCSAAPSENVPFKPFSFEAWVRGIIENPDGDNLTPEEAIAAYNATIATAKLSSRGADPAVKCNTVPKSQCYVPDAVACINYLARKGQTPCRTQQSGESAFCNAPQCHIVGDGQPWTSAPCNDVAITSGRIMDSCTQGNNVQGSRICVTQPNYQINFFGHEWNN